MKLVVIHNTEVRLEQVTASVYESEHACFEILPVKVNVIYANIIGTKCEINRLIDCLFWDA